MTLREAGSRIMHLSAPVLSGLREGSNQEDRRNAVLILVLIALCILIVPLFIAETASKREAHAVRAKLKEVSAVAAEYRSLKERTDALEQRKSLATSKVNGIPQAMDEISSSLGLKGKVKAVKAIGKREVAGGSEETEEVQIEKVTMNELVNMLYAIDDAPMMLSLRRLSMKKTFENPELLNASLTLSFFTKK
ncbi:MAG TPA: hypothetical protein VEI96_01495 [Thermodesulfovibrionales bacterium]|nr:hypothetical protein [Thermodesulfovibrionales bacterium]